MTGSLLLDLVLTVLLAGYALSGYRHGIVRGAFALAGFVGGAVLGLWLMPQVLPAFGVRVTGTASGVLATIVGIVICVAAGQSFGAWLGHRIRSHLRWAPVRVLDGVLGAVANVVVAAVLVWFVAATARPAVPPAVSSAISGSGILRGIDRVVPDQADKLFAGFRQLLDAQDFPRVFAGVAPEPIAPVDPPQTSVSAAPAIQAASASVVRIRGNASCDRGQEGSGWVLAAGRVVTNAHVVAGVGEPTVQILGQGRYYSGRVVLFDAARDIAVIDVPDLSAPALKQGAALIAGDSAVVAGFPLDGPYTLAPARVRQLLTATGEDIYGTRNVTRSIYSLYTKVEPGSSGGPLLSTDGSVVGVVFARSLDDPATGYALTLAEVQSDLRAGAAATGTVSTGACTAA